MAATRDELLDAAIAAVTRLSGGAGAGALPATDASHPAGTLQWDGARWTRQPSGRRHTHADGTPIVERPISPGWWAYSATQFRTEDGGATMLPPGRGGLTVNDMWEASPAPLAGRRRVLEQSLDLPHHELGGDRDPPVGPPLPDVGAHVAEGGGALFDGGDAA